MELENQLFCCSKNLNISKQKVNDEIRFIIKNLDTDKFYVFTENQFQLFKAFDGKRTISDVQQYMRERQIKLSLEQIASFTKQLDELHMFEDKQAVKKVKNRVVLQKGNTLFQRLLVIKVNLLNPNAFLDKLYSKVGFVFSKAFVFFSSIYFIISLFLYRSQMKTTHLMNGTLAENGVVLILLFLTVIFSSFFHELAHAIVCRKYGGNVTDIGLLSIYFQVGVYCNISDAYLFKEKKHRIYVSLAGIYIDSIIWSTIIMLGYILGVEGVAQNYYMLFGNFGLISMLLEMNPLIKLDGYYVLAEWLDQYNLRDQAFQYVKNSCFKRQNLKKSSQRDKKIYLIYTVFSSIYCIGMIISLLYLLFKYLILRFQMIGIVMSILLLILLFSRQINSLLGKLIHQFIKRKVNSIR